MGFVWDLFLKFKNKKNVFLNEEKNYTSLFTVRPGNQRFSTKWSDQPEQ